MLRTQTNAYQCTHLKQNKQRPTALALPKPGETRKNLPQHWATNIIRRVHRYFQLRRRQSKQNSKLKWTLQWTQFSKSRTLVLTRIKIFPKPHNLIKEAQKRVQLKRYRLITEFPGLHQIQTSSAIKRSLSTVLRLRKCLPQDEAQCNHLRNQGTRKDLAKSLFRGPRRQLSAPSQPKGFQTSI